MQGAVAGGSLARRHREKASVDQTEGKGKGRRGRDMAVGGGRDGGEGGRQAGKEVERKTGRETLGLSANREGAVKGRATLVLAPESGKACRARQDLALITGADDGPSVPRTCQQVLLTLTLSSGGKINMQKRLLKHSGNILNSSLKHNNSRVNMLSLENSFPFGTFSYFSLIGTHSGNFPFFLPFF